MSTYSFCAIGTPGLLTVKRLDWDVTNRVWNGSAYVSYNSADFATYITGVSETGALGIYGGAIAAGAVEGWHKSTYHIGSTESVLVGFDWNPARPISTYLFGLVGTSGLTVKALHFNVAEETWDGSDYSAYSSGSWASYGTSTPEIGNLGVYGAAVPTLAVTEWAHSYFFVSAAESVALAYQHNDASRGSDPAAGELAPSSIAKLATIYTRPHTTIFNQSIVVPESDTQVIHFEPATAAEYESSAGYTFQFQLSITENGNTSVVAVTPVVLDTTKPKLQVTVPSGITTMRGYALVATAPQARTLAQGTILIKPSAKSG